MITSLLDFVVPLNLACGKFCCGFFVAWALITPVRGGSPVDLWANALTYLLERLKLFGTNDTYHDIAPSDVVKLKQKIYDLSAKTSYQATPVYSAISPVDLENYLDFWKVLQSDNLLGDSQESYQTLASRLVSLTLSTQGPLPHTKYLNVFESEIPNRSRSEIETDHPLI